MKKVVIAYASAGTGHLKAAEAVYDYLKAERNDLDMVLIDVLDKTNPFFKLTYTRGYAFLISHLAIVWQWLFWVTSVRRWRILSRRLSFFADTLNAVRFSRFLRLHQADVIVSTHFLTSEIAADLKRKGKIQSKLITVITDFGVHPFWISEGTDLYITASYYTNEKISLLGVPPERLQASGVPVHSRFLQRFDRAALRQKLGIDPEGFTVLVVTGSFGIGPIEEIVQLISPVVQVIVVCARNKHLYQTLTEKKYPGVLVFGFVDNIEELMAASDVIVTKPGGLSICESLVMQLVPIFVAPIPGQEMENIRAMQSFGIGFFPPDYSGIKDIIMDLKANPEKLNAIKIKIAGISRPRAASDISDAIR